MASVVERNTRASLIVVRRTRAKRSPAHTTSAFACPFWQTTPSTSLLGASVVARTSWCRHEKMPPQAAVRATKCLLLPVPQLLGPVDTAGTTGVFGVA
jgi:hypothetical protein